MFLREPPTTTLEDVHKSLDGLLGGFEVISAEHPSVEVHFTDQESQIKIKGEKKTREVPLSPSGFLELSRWLDVPTKFADRIDPELRTTVFNRLLSYPGAFDAVIAKDHGLIEVRDPKVRYYDPRAIVDIAARVVAPNAPAVDWWRESGEFRLDVIVPDGHAKIVGDKPTKRTVGDLSKPGLRFGHEVKHQGHAPFVQKFAYRLLCTNGMEVPDYGLKVDARGQSIDEVMAELELAAQRAFVSVEEDMAHFYAMREEKVTDPAKALSRIARENELPDRTRLDLIDLFHADQAEGHIPETDVTMFHVLAVVTNLANEEGYRSRANLARRLEVVGGRTLSEHVTRCRTCASKLN